MIIDFNFRPEIAKNRRMIQGGGRLEGLTISSDFQDLLILMSRNRAYFFASLFLILAFLATSFPFSSLQQSLICKPLFPDNKIGAGPCHFKMKTIGFLDNSFNIRMNVPNDMGPHPISPSAVSGGPIKFLPPIKIALLALRC